jgi:hypothetical protein
VKSHSPVGLVSRQCETSNLAASQRKPYWLPNYIKVTRPVFEILKMAGYFPDSLRIRVRINCPAAYQHTLLLPSDGMKHEEQSENSLSMTVFSAFIFRSNNNKSDVTILLSHYLSTNLPPNWNIYIIVGPVFAFKVDISLSLVTTTTQMTQRSTSRSPVYLWSAWFRFSAGNRWKSLGTRSGIHERYSVSFVAAFLYGTLTIYLLIIRLCIYKFIGGKD